MFEVNLWYENNIGKYQVLAVIGDQMEVRYANGQKQILSVKIQTRIQENKQIQNTLQLEPQSGGHHHHRAPYHRIGLKAYFTMGFLFVRLRWLGLNLKQDKNDRYINQAKDDYLDATGKELSLTQDGVCLLREGAHQRSNQGVIRFPAKDTELPFLQFSSDDNRVYVSGNLKEVKDIKFVFFLLEHGFDLGLAQDDTKILAHIPEPYQESFSQGWAYAEG